MHKKRHTLWHFLYILDQKMQNGMKKSKKIQKNFYEFTEKILTDCVEWI